MNITSKEIAKKYNCEVFKDMGFDSEKRYWVALGNENAEFEYVDGWTLEELIKNIENKIMSDK